MKKIITLIILTFTLFSCSSNDSKENPKDIENENISYSIPDSLNFNTVNDKLILSINNDGKTTINYSITSSKSYITLSSNTGNITANNHSEVAISVDRKNLVSGKVFSKLYLNINNKKDSIVVSVNNFIEQKTFLQTDVVDAEFSKSTNQLVYVSASPAAVNILTSASGTTQSIPLLYVPTCISISQDGKTAAVGHDAHITYIDLNTKSVINTYDISCYAIDIVLTSNKWAYVFPERDQRAQIRCVNLNIPNNNENLHTGNQIYAGTKARLQPFTNYIYGANNGLTPSDIEKYSIQNGIAQYVYDSPYHGDYPMNGNLWFSEDGTRIFTRGKTVLKTSEIRNQDMIYNGKINTDSNSNIEWLDHSSAKNNLYLILTTGDSWTPKKAPFIYVYNSSNLTYKKKIELEKYMIISNNGVGKFYDPEPYFAFSDSSGNNLFVITKATGAGLNKEWSFQKITIE
ncbi:BACON domain-containing protein [Flavobacterium sp. N502540]|uniref:BACON domain-containing protein n=1 Tax=Flavobacterium sp. N502540 TaxID=2986838 RepID=UPI002225571F|nr:hypothetical protein [Flavobacterium sp. N502540]